MYIIHFIKLFWVKICQNTIKNSKSLIEEQQNYQTLTVLLLATLLSDYYRWEEALNGRRIHEKTFEKLLSLEEKFPLVLECYDELQILYQWLREMIDYHGYHYEDAISMCRWIFKKMEEAAGEDCHRLKKVLAKTSRNLPSVLGCLKRGEDSLKVYAVEHGYSSEAFILMYRIQGYQPNFIEYQAADRRIRHLLKGAYGSCYLEMQGILEGVKRASILVENLNGRLRKYMNLKRMVPKNFYSIKSVLQYETIPEVLEGRACWKKAERLL